MKINGACERGCLQSCWKEVQRSDIANSQFPSGCEYFELVDSLLGDELQENIVPSINFNYLDILQSLVREVHSLVLDCHVGLLELSSCFGNLVVRKHA